jgi:rod shape-determining protein MreB
VRVAGDELDNAIIAYIKRNYNLLIGERTAEHTKMEVGSAYPYEGEEPYEIKGRNLVDGLPKNVFITPEEVRRAIADPISAIMDAIRTTLERTPPELAADIRENGIILTGGGALLTGFGQAMANRTKIPVNIAEDPERCAALGTAKSFEYLGKLYDGFVTGGGK